MDHLSFLVLGIIVLVVVFMVFSTIGKFQQTRLVAVKIGNATIQAEIADTIPKQVRGLMFRESLPANHGMLFTFDSEGKHGIWMMNMSIPLDIIWLDSQKKVIHIEKNVPPCDAVAACKVYTPSNVSKFVLEVNAGFTEKHGITIGSKGKFDL